jgi:hypothetical protein
VTTHLEQDDALALSNDAPLADKLRELKRARFTPEGKDERVARSLAALNQQAGISLSTDSWRHIIEESDLEDQF